jgi:hypothetical protein
MIPPTAPGTLERRPFSSKQAAPSALPNYHHALCLLLCNSIHGTE